MKILEYVRFKLTNTYSKNQIKTYTILVVTVIVGIYLSVNDDKATISNWRPARTHLKWSIIKIRFHII